MLDHLIDGDPASNTLSWRWVAGLHTTGKAYLANADRIRAMAGGRFAPSGLARSAVIPADNIVVPAASPPRIFKAPDHSLPTALLLTAEDLSLETVPAFETLNVKALAVMPGETAADRTALNDGLARAKLRWPDALVVGPLTRAALDRVKVSGCRQIVTGFAPVGPIAVRLELLRQKALQEGLLFAEYLRAWDRRAWPHCRKGFSALREKIPTLINEAGHAP